MCYRLKRHPIAVRAHFRHSLVLTYAFPADALRPLLPPGLALDTFRGFGFLAMAMVQTEHLRPALLPSWMGRSFFLTGYRLFVQHRDRSGITRRGLRILRSDTNRRAMQWLGNTLTHYQYRLAETRLVETDDRLEIVVRTPAREADLHVIADLGSRPDAPPALSPFRTLNEARRYAGPLPHTFDYEWQTHSIIRIKGVRDQWNPRPVRVEVRENTFLEHAPFDLYEPVLANAFLVSDVNYRWERGVREPLEESPNQQHHLSSGSHWSGGLHPFCACLFWKGAHHAHLFPESCGRRCNRVGAHLSDLSHAIQVEKAA